MPTYYGHKPSWKQSGPRASAGSVVLEMDRQPSGGYSFEGRAYKPDLRSGGGGRSVPTVPPNRRWGDPGRPEARKAAQFGFNRSLAGKALRGIGFASDMAQFANAVYSGDYDWEDFWEGKLPPPFDWLNADIPKEWMPTAPSGDPASVPQYPSSPFNDLVWQEPNDVHNPNSWVAVKFPFDTSSGMMVWKNFTSLHDPATGRHNHPGGAVERDQNVFPHDPLLLPVNNWSGPDTYETPVGFRYGYRLFWALANKPSGYLDWNEQVVETRWGDWCFGQAFMPGSVRPPVFSEDGAVEISSGNPTKEAALEAVGIKPAGLTFVPDWPYIPNFAVGARNFIGALNGTHSETVPVDPVNQGGTKTIGNPGGPVITVPTKPGEPPHPPGNGTKEKKARVGAGLFKVAQSLFHGITEYGDLVDALFDAIPKAKRCKTKSLVGKSMCVFTHLDDIDIGDAIVNIAWNEFEDRIIGAGFGLNAKAAKARGDRYAFRTQNSVNGFGGVDQLGELYGDFSKEYVNPRKQDLKDFLTRKFGI